MPGSKDHPVAVVYYRYDKNAPETAAKDHAHDGIYYVHNGVAVENLPTATGGARVRHVGTWPRLRSFTSVQQKRQKPPHKATESQGVIKTLKTKQKLETMGL